MEVYGWTSESEARDHVKVYEGENGNYQSLLDDRDLDVEAVIIALPLHLHAEAAIYAMKQGKHVLSEKLMAHSVAECKEMARAAASMGKVLAVGHQRHYSILYDNAVDQIRRGLIGNIHHIRAQWHRANLPGNDSWQPPLPCPILSEADYVALRRQSRAGGKEAQIRSEYKLLEELHSWERKLNAFDPRNAAKATEMAEWATKVAQKRAQLADIALKGKVEQYGYEAKTLPGGYERSALEELIRWRLWERTGGGLMAELGSHQLDAASIFITAQRKDGRKVKPLSVTGIGGRHIFPADRECEDHVYCTFEFPGIGYYRSEDSYEVKDPNKKIVVTYSSINGNGFGGYGEVVFGTEGTLILEREQDAMLFKGSSTTTRIEVRQGADGPAMDTYETGGGAAVAQAAAPTDVSRGYREEIEHWAWCIRNPAPDHQPRCTPEVALADAVIALTSNLAIAKGGRIDFEPAWFDVDSDETPEGTKPRSTSALA
jgi:predicted dehydrogenase